jgi:16S rRNA (guanine527-N7)-methyltransferase
MTEEKEADFTLVDSIGKKVKVVNSFIETLELKNIKAIQARAEELGQDANHREKYNFVVSRATAYLPTLLEYTLPLLSLGGIFASYKLDNDAEIEEAQKALDILG